MIWRCGNVGTETDCGCGDSCEKVLGLTPEEFDAVAHVFIIRLQDAMARAGCNDLFESEFPKSICERFRTDFAVLAAFHQALFPGEIWSRFMA